ncbi:MAG: DUF177 domain-containing protein [Chloroflexi bacterium]|nr:DUF177 domain-containing protein [Chloroflexota bacterium]
MLVSVAPLLREAVGARESYDFAESPIDPHGENAGLLEAGVREVDAVLNGTHTDPGIFVEGKAKASVDGQCSRCLTAIAVPVEAEFAEQYYVTRDVISGASLDNPAPVDAKTIGSDFRIDFTPLLAEELIIATPFAPLCQPDCRGLCEVCGEDRNQRPHQHEEAGDPRWAKLKDLEGFQADRD